MDIRKTYKRSEVDERYTWDLSSFYKSEEEYNLELKKSEEDVDLFVEKYKGNLNDEATIAEALDMLRDISERIYKAASYRSLEINEDNTNGESMSKYMECMGRLNIISTKINFFESEILANDEELLVKVGEKYPENKVFIKDLLRRKSIMLSEEVEEVLTKLNMPLNSFNRIYDASKLQDMKFEDFEANGEMHPLSYNIYEGLMENEQDINLRRNSFRAFSDKLEEYKNVTAAAYLGQVQKEKAMADIRGFDSVIDYLLFDQEVDRDLYNRQIDTIMEDLSPIMRRYAKLLEKVHGLDKIRYEDLKIELDGDFSKEISVEEARDMILDGLSVLGDDYTDMVKRAFDERWIDLVNNVGKSTGAFCSSPYGVHPYILISWTGKMTETMVLAHELGHAGHFYLNQKEQNIFDTRSSRYFIEAPSTTNELIMANSLLENAKDKREKRYYLSQIIARTYYHNFVTHLLEAAYQREVYYLIDEGKSFNADLLSDIYLKVLKDFWGDDVELTKGAELTWMRQPHYYMGLYPYTYSAGLTIGTEVSQKILDEGQPAVDRWIETLKLGGTKDPVGLAKTAGVDITTDKPLKNTINYIGSIVDELEKLTEELGE